MSERFNPTDAELVEWLAERAFQLRMEHSPDAATVARSQWMADQLERCAKALKSHMVHSSWVPVKEWTPTEGELETSVRVSQRARTDPLRRGAVDSARRRGLGSRPRRGGYGSGKTLRGYEWLRNQLKSSTTCG
jgi:hypothetical protein